MQHLTEFAAPSAIEIDWFDDGEVVAVTPRDLQRFEIQKDKAIKFLQLANDADKQLQYLMGVLAEWLREHADKVRDAYLTLRDAKFAFLVIAKAAEFDDDLEDSVSDLDIRVAVDPDLDAIRMNAIVLPPASREALASFMDRNFLMVYRGERS